MPISTPCSPPSTRPSAPRASRGSSSRGRLPGLSIGKVEDKMGQRALNVAEVILQEVRVPVENRLGREGDGFKIAMQSLDEGRVNIAACAVGVARAAYEAALAYARERVQFDKPIGTFQAITFLLADMAAAVDCGAPARLARRLAGRPGAALRPPGGPGQVLCHRCGHAGHHRRGADPRRQRLHPGLPRGEVHARCQTDADLRGDQPDQPAGGRRAPCFAARARPQTGPARGGRRCAGVGRPASQPQSPWASSGFPWRSGRCRPRSLRAAGPPRPEGEDR